ncbi:MAG: hypothetical protein AAGJ46_07195 [Planctomycetota bacterium]
MPLILLWSALAIASLCVWLYGEAADKPVLRRASAFAVVVLFTVAGSLVSGIHTALSIGIPVSTAVHEYVDAARVQLAAGEHGFVAERLEGFKRRAPVTYETGLFLDQVNEEAKRMRAGP